MSNTRSLQLTSFVHWIAAVVLGFILSLPGEFFFYKYLFIVFLMCFWCICACYWWVMYETLLFIIRNYQKWLKWEYNKFCLGLYGLSQTYDLCGINKIDLFWWINIEILTYNAVSLRKSRGFCFANSETDCFYFFFVGVEENITD